MERLYLRIIELENQNLQLAAKAIFKPTVNNQPPPNPPAIPRQPEMLTAQQVASYFDMSVACVRKWRVRRKGPKFVKIGRSIRYKRGDVESWLDSCSGLS